MPAEEIRITKRNYQENLKKIGKKSNCEENVDKTADRQVNNSTMEEQDSSYSVSYLLSSLRALFIWEKSMPEEKECCSEDDVQFSQKFNSEDEVAIQRSPTNFEGFNIILFIQNLLTTSHRDLVTPHSLVNCLSAFENFSASIQSVTEILKCSDSYITQVTNSNKDIFAIEADNILLTPKLAICQEYNSLCGCVEKRSCKDLHLCPLYVVSSCSDVDCVLGHILKTDHNERIYEQFCINDLSTMDLHSLFRTIGSSLWSVKESVTICEDYNTGNCKIENCKSIHFCSAFLVKQCKGWEKCKLNHDILSISKDILKIYGLPVNESPKDILDIISRGAVVNTTMWFDLLCGETKKSEICFNSVESCCPLEKSGCPRLHSNQHFHWQVKSENERWINLRHEQVIALEKAYCDPEKDEVDIPVLNPSKLEHHLKDLLSLMKGRKQWKAKFADMKLHLSDPANSFLNLRRICSEKIVGNVVPDPCLFSWYFLDVNNTWIEYGCVDSTGDSILKCSRTSDDIENHYQQKKEPFMIVRSGKFSYTLDFNKMIQINNKTKVQRPVKRRPKRHLELEDEEVGVEESPPHWDTMKPGELIRRVNLNSNTVEYQQILNYYTVKGGTTLVLKIERVQNPYLWWSFQNKVREMTSIYNNNKEAVNIQQLFHGTKANVVDSICQENFDWRLHGSNVGQAHGRGTYFSPFSNVSYGYTEKDPQGNRCMFIARVAVGSVTRGHNSTVRPPHNPATNRLFDSTVDKYSNTTMVVKYDKQEYYPEYILTVS